MTKFKIGYAVVSIEYLDNNTYAGVIEVPGKDVSWKFSDLHPAPVGFGPGIAYDSRKALRIMAKCAVTFGSYYSSDNRGSETPDWAPPSDVADAINEATFAEVND